MTFRDLHETFRDIEDRYELFGRRIEGMPFWDYLRFPVWYRVLEESGTCDKPQRVETPEGLWASLGDSMRKLKYSAVRNPFLASECEFLFIGHPRRRLMPDGTYWDAYCDHIIDHLGGDRCLLLERRGGSLGRHLQPAHTRRLAYTDAFALHRRLPGTGLSPMRLGSGDREMLARIDREFHERTGTNTDLEGLLQRKVREHRIKTPLYERLVKRLRPRAALLVCSYGLEPEVAVFRRHGVPTIELQHGVITPYHPGYAYPPGAGKELFPDYFFSFGRFWEESVGLPLRKERMLTLGYPFLEESLGAYKSTGKRKRILFLSQGAIGGSLSRFAVGLQERLPEDWELVYKLHPGEIPGWRDRCPHLAASSITVVEGDKPPLYQLMSKARIQIGVFSTALFEGLALGCRTYVVSLPGHEYMETLISRGEVDKIDDPRQVCLDDGDARNPRQGSDFFAPHWRNNLERALESIGLMKRNGPAG